MVSGCGKGLCGSGGPEQVASRFFLGYTYDFLHDDECWVRGSSNFSWEEGAMLFGLLK